MTFRDELARYRKRLLFENQDGPCEKRHLQLASEILDRWQHHAGVEFTWDTLKAKLPANAMPTADEYITLVLNRSLLWNRVADIVRELPAVENRRRIEITRLWRTDDDYDLAAIKRFMLNKYLALCVQLLGRKKTRAAQKHFMRGWTNKFKKLCGDPLTEVVRVLTEVAFDEEVTPQAVRDSEKATTLRSRQ